MRFIEDHRKLCASPTHPRRPEPVSPIKEKGEPPDGHKKQPLGYIPVNECILRPDICGEGECIDTFEGYECHCKPGYRKGHKQVCEG